MPAADDFHLHLRDDPLLADGETHYEAQPVFLVLATSHRAARVAARRAKVSATPLPAETSMPSVWPW
jgi:xanthine dehydrogenase large subunit